MDFEKLVVSLFFAGIFSLIVGVTVYNLHANAQIADMVSRGVHPQVAACAINGGNELLCAGFVR
jgi:hypothetical protein